MNILTYHGFKRVIKELGQIFDINLQNSKMDKNSSCLKLILSCTKGCRQVYDILVKSNERPNCCNKWEQKIQGNINWKRVFNTVRKVGDINLRWFQMRITHRIIGTRVILKSMGVADSESCYFCPNERENIEHMFWDCPVSQSFWTQFNHLVTHKCPHVFNMRMSKGLILMGEDEGIVTDKIFVLILLLAKQYLYCCKRNNSIPDITVLKKRLSNRYKIEEFNSKMSFSHAEFVREWLMYKNMCLT